MAQVAISMDKRPGNQSIPRSGPVARSVNPEMVTLARQSRGMTQTDLANKAGITQGMLSKIENSLVDPTDDVVDRLSTALGYPESFFRLTDAVTGIGVSQLLYRRKQAVPNKTLDTIQARVNIVRMHITRLLRSVDMGEFDFPDLDPSLFPGGAAEVASLLREHWKLPTGPVRDMVTVIEEAGGIVVPFDFGDACHQIDGLSYWSRGSGIPPLFFINPKAPGDRLRFTLGHELGHMIMHTLHPSNEVEDEANEFSSELLMPAREIRSQLSGGLSVARLAALKSYWKVSMAALLVRAHRLRIVGESSYRSLMIQVKAYGKNEPVEIPREEPQLLRDIIQTYRTDMAYTVTDLARLLHLRDEEVKYQYLPHEAPRLQRVK
jgi:Zn-dependent peptidase ImmA (M78 family)/transcriptional regulator with XRE-family HTH domain